MLKIALQARAMSPRPCALLGRLADGREEVVEQADGVRHLRRRGHDGEHRGHAADDVEEDLPAPHQVGAERAFEAADLLRPVLGTAPDLNVRTRRNEHAPPAARRSPLAARRSPRAARRSPIMGPCTWPADTQGSCAWTARTSPKALRSASDRPTASASGIPIRSGA